MCKKKEEERKKGREGGGGADFRDSSSSIARAFGGREGGLAIKAMMPIDDATRFRHIVAANEREGRSRSSP